MPQGIVPFPFGQCRICNDKATGVHYGVATCEGCKGFYKRSTTRAEKYKCFFGGSCKLSPQNRNRCKACRYQICLDAGMSLDAVKMGRIPKVDKERALEAEHSKVLNHSESTEISHQNTEDKLPLHHAETGYQHYPMFETAEQKPAPLYHQRMEEDEDYKHEGVEGDTFVQTMDPATSAFVPQGGPARGDLVNSGSEMLHSSSQHQQQQQQHSPELESTMQVPQGQQQQQAAASHPNHPTTTHALVHHPPTHHHHHQQQHEQHPQMMQQQQTQQHQLQQTQQHHYPPNDARLVHGREAELYRNGEPSHGESTGDHSMSPPEYQQTSLPMNRSSSCSSSSSGSFLHNGRSSASSGFSHSTCSTSLNPSSLTSSFGRASICSFDSRSSEHSLPPHRLNHNNGGSVGVMVTGPEEYVEGAGGGMGGAARQLHLQRTHPYVRPPQWRDSNSGMSENRSLSSSPCDSSPGGSTLSRPHQVYSPSIIHTLLSQVLDGSDQQLLTELIQRMNPSPPPTPPSLSPPIPSSKNALSHRLLDLLLKGSQPARKSSESLESLLLQQLLSNILKSQPNSPCSSTSSVMSSPSPRVKLEPMEEGVESPVRIQGIRSVEDTKNEDNTQEVQEVRNLINSHIESNSQSPGATTHQQNPGAENGNHEKENAESMSKQSHSLLESLARMDTDDTSATKDASKIAAGEGLPPSDRIRQIQETIQRCSEINLKHNDFKRENIAQMMDEVNGIIKPHYLNSLKEASIMQVKYMWKSIFASIPKVNEWLLSMTKEFPGFKNLKAGDQGILMQSAYFDIWLMQNASFYYKGESYMRMEDGQAYSRWWQRHFLPQDFVNKMFRFIEDLQACELTETEVIILCAIQLSDPDPSKGLEELENVQMLHNHYLDVLAYEIQNTHPHNHSRVLINIFRILPMLGPLNHQQNQIIGSFSIDKPGDGVLKCNPDSTDVGGIPEEELKKLYEEEAKKKEEEAAATLPLSDS